MNRSRIHTTALAVGLTAGLLTPPGPQASPLHQHLPVCAGCHGRDGISATPDTPSLAGMDGSYLLRQLKHFKSGQRKSAVMNGIVAALDEEAMSALASHYGEQRPAAAEAGGDPALVRRGKLIYEEGIVDAAVPACSSCHGDDGAGDAKYPRLAGQRGPYVARQLEAFRSGERANDLKGVMGAVAKRMSDADIRAVATYVSTMNKD